MPLMRYCTACVLTLWYGLTNVLDQAVLLLHWKDRGVLSGMGQKKCPLTLNSSFKDMYGDKSRLLFCNNIYSKTIQLKLEFLAEMFAPTFSGGASVGLQYRQVTLLPGV